ncbi:zinc/manganese transport system permease protein [Ectothiorhodosinus mongolicus]|uniref:Zinc/manganese transport system permease protein n=1 Tax=Ectothiorhodosinus mongolicus TaxID=233100 RepID=A0A1R3W0K1_9GAMM|nr:ABC transporter [Ectothiorhodosinus mongolicus]SIT69342.1 zinc/manganese transport system permease protein [Ectothiorhodosinus mongolicus]
MAFATGLGMAAVLGLASAGLFLRGSIWQALAVSQWSALGGVFASTLALPILPVALGTAALAIAFLHWKNDAQRWPMLLFLGGIAGVMLLAGNFGQAELAAARWAEGQLYFVTRDLSLVALLVLVASAILFPRLLRQWLLTQAGPDLGKGTRLSLSALLLEASWWTCVIVLGTVTMGLPASLALLLLPAWAATPIARHARGFVLTSLVIAVFSYVLAWFTALYFDQAFAPVLVACLILITAVMHLGRRLNIVPGA